MYGGAGGGGKTVALLSAALQFVNIPGYSALLLRRTYPDLSLPKALMDLSHLWFDGTEARWDQLNHTWHFPTGARLVFGYCESVGDEQRYRSAEFQFIGVDEVTEWFELQYVFLFSRLRRPVGMAVPLRMRCATNPGGPGHNWVKQRFLVEGKRHGRAFIPARLEDNPELDQATYRESLLQLDPVRRKQILEGCWDAQLGTMFRREWFSDRIIEPSDVPADIRKVRFWDLASTEVEKGKDPDWTSGTLAGLKDGQLFIFDIVRFRGSPKQTEDRVRQTADVDGKAVQVWMEEEGGSSGKIASDHYAREVLVGFNYHGTRSTGDKVTRAGPLSACAERKNVFLVRGDWISALLDEAEVFPEGEHDDQVDSASGAFAVLSGQRRSLGKVAFGDLEK
jgi:predicted phage terminase large subunit-like protein